MGWGTALDKGVREEITSSRNLRALRRDQG